MKTIFSGLTGGLVKKRVAATILGILLLAGIVFFLTRKRPQPQEFPTVRIETASLEDVELYGEFVGRIRAQQFVEVRARRRLSRRDALRGRYLC